MLGQNWYANRPTSLIESKVDLLVLESNQRRIDETLDWTSAIPYASHHDYVKDRIVPGTCEWLLQRSDFRTWLHSESSRFLWLHGIRGSGKTFLASKVISQLQSDADTLLAYFYCSKSAQQSELSQRTPILRCLLRQLAAHQNEQQLPKRLIGKYDNRHQGRLSAEDTVDLIIELVSAHSSTHIVIDALDECDAGSRSELIFDLRKIMEKASCPVRIFVTSGDDHNLSRLMVCPIDVEVNQKTNSEDISTFVRFKVDQAMSRNSLQVSQELRLRIVAKLVSDAQGMFLWAEMQLQHLLGLKRERSIEERLGKLPESLSTLYQDMFDEHLPTQLNERQMLFSIYQTLLGSLCQFKSEGFLNMLWSADDSADDMSVGRVLDICGRFVAYDEYLDIFRFSHSSVKEFLEEFCIEKTSRGTPDKKVFQTSKTHLWMLQKCLAILSHNTSVPYRTKCYALFYWAAHAELVPALETTEVGAALTDFLSREGRVFLNWYYDMTDIRSEAPTVLLNTFPVSKFSWTAKSAPDPLVVACEWNLESVVRNLMRRDQSCLLMHESFSSALRLAAAQNRPRLINILLSETNSDEGTIREAFEDAVRHGSREAIQLLLVKGASFSWTEVFSSLKVASISDALRGLRFLLDAGDTLRATIPSQLYPRRESSAPGIACISIPSPNITEAVRMVRLLLDWLAERPNTIIDRETQREEEHLIDILLQDIPGPTGPCPSDGHDAGQELDRQDDRGYSTLHHAVCSNSFHAAQLLLHKGARPNTCTEDGTTPLHSAALRCDSAIVSLLIEHGASVNARDKRLETALFEAARKGHMPTLRVLLNCKADTNVQNRFGWTALASASHLGWDEAANMMMQHNTREIALHNRQSTAAIA